MKKLILLLVLAVTMSCSNDEQIDSNNVSESNTLSILDNQMLSFTNKESFIKEYSELSYLKSEKELQNWISEKGLKSLFNTLNDSIQMENDVLSDSRIIYSDPLKAVFNSESKVKIEGKTIWLNERNFYVLSENEIDKSSSELVLIKDRLEIYGKLLSISNSKNDTKLSLASRQVVPNENRVKTYVVGLPNNSRYVLDLFNETIVINNYEISSSKMYLRCTLQYKSCSVWRCTWKNDTVTPWYIYNNNLSAGVSFPWNFISPSMGGVGTQTTLLANLVTQYALPSNYQYPNFSVYGNIVWSYQAPYSVPYSQALSWY